MLLKRVIDLAIATVLMAILIWFVPIVALIIRRESAGPVFFTQERVGKDRKLFRCIKLRTMHVGTENTGSHQVKANAVTKNGRFLRRTKFDELPQLWNVIVGEMSLIGPRPCLPTQSEVIFAREKHGINATLPGISGLAQIHNIDMSQPGRLTAHDLCYIRNASFCLDMYIILATIGITVRRTRRHDSGVI